MNTVNEQDGRMTPGDVPATRVGYLDYEGRSAFLFSNGWSLFYESEASHTRLTHAKAVEWVSNCPLYLERLRKTKPVAPTRFADADLSTWCQRYEGEPDEGVVCGTWDDCEAIGEPGGDICAERGRHAVRSGIGWFIYGDGGRAAREWRVTRPQAVAWVRYGVLP